MTTDTPKAHAEITQEHRDFLSDLWRQVERNFDAAVQLLADREAEVRHRQANWMLDAIRASLREYPNAGRDIEVMKEVERISTEVERRARIDEQRNHGNHDWGCSYLWKKKPCDCPCGKRIAELEAR